MHTGEVQPKQKRTLSVFPVWALALVGAVSVLLIAPQTARLAWLAIIMALCILVTFAVQLVVAEKDGLVNRMTASLVGSVLILALATGVAALL